MLSSLTVTLVEDAVTTAVIRSEAGQIGEIRPLSTPCESGLYLGERRLLLRNDRGADAAREGRSLLRTIYEAARLSRRYSLHEDGQCLARVSRDWSLRANDDSVKLTLEVAAVAFVLRPRGKLAPRSDLLLAGHRVAEVSQPVFTQGHATMKPVPMDTAIAAFLLFALAQMQG
ncbi:hypothetical protein [Tahibacter amnicola]|uniref:Uncharacterized protein n=1 Tax=Tahibacter amnicola TaxID=2976241 RepID=A0ABY6BDL2_9GAMM|nr:hypothetical protein [Tahibacter amnicola]UXI68121.1 hypothetical protein N4264_00265 [Tahibacter amnicola]